MHFNIIFFKIAPFSHPFLSDRPILAENKKRQPFQFHPRERLPPVYRVKSPSPVNKRINYRLSIPPGAICIEMLSLEVVFIHARRHLFSQAL